MSPPLRSAKDLTQRLMWLAQQAGFPVVACGPAGVLPDHVRYQAWLAAQHAGDLVYLYRDAAQRADPRLLLDRGLGVLSVAVSYHHPDPPPLSAPDALRGQIARYARSEDYHLVLKRRLQALANRIQAEFGAEAPLAYRVCVDTAPILERALGAQHGLGFVGKNTLLITPAVGSYTVLGELILELPLEAAQATSPRCGDCRLCRDRCPTGALIDDYVLDARRCISYWTIENQGEIPLAMRAAIGTWIFGCDLCQEVCPWNASPTAQRSGDPGLAPRPSHSQPALLSLLGLGAAQFRQFVRRTALRRLHRSQLLRNVAVALGNVGTPRELPALLAALAKEPPLIRQHLAWALGEIAARHPASARDVSDSLRRTLATEPEPRVRHELQAALDRLPTCSLLQPLDRT